MSLSFHGRTRWRLGRWLAKTAHDNGLAIDLKNANDLVKESEDYKTALVDAFDYNVIESCVNTT